MRLVIDTNIYSDFAEGKEDVVEYLANFRGALYIPVIVLGELNYGFRKGSKLKRNEENLMQFKEIFNAEIICVDEDVASIYSTIVLNLEKRGKKIPVNDAWIAACCMSIGGTLYSRDEKHFSDIENLNMVAIS